MECQRKIKLERASMEISTLLREFGVNPQNTWFNIQPIIHTCDILTKDYDESHDVYHHIEVCKNALAILSSTKIKFSKAEFDQLLRNIIYASLLHDTIDHKYPANLSEKKLLLEIFLKEKIGSAWKEIVWIISNTSYSKEVKSGYPRHDNPIIQLSRTIVADADRIDAVGKSGLKRCFAYSKAINPSATDEELVQMVVDHCHDKLLKLKDNFIVTPHGQKMAEPSHQYLMDFVNNATKK